MAAVRKLTEREFFRKKKSPTWWNRKENVFLCLYKHQHLVDVCVGLSRAENSREIFTSHWLFVFSICSVLKKYFLVDEGNYFFVYFQLKFSWFPFFEKGKFFFVWWGNFRKLINLKWRFWFDFVDFGHVRRTKWLCWGVKKWLL